MTSSETLSRLEQSTQQSSTSTSSAVDIAQSDRYSVSQQNLVVLQNANNVSLVVHSP